MQNLSNAWFPINLNKFKQTLSTFILKKITSKRKWSIILLHLKKTCNSAVHIVSPREAFRDWMKKSPPGLARCPKHTVPKYLGFSFTHKKMLCIFICMWTIFLRSVSPTTVDVPQSGTSSIYPFHYVSTV